MKNYKEVLSLIFWVEMVSQTDTKLCILNTWNKFKYEGDMNPFEVNVLKRYTNALKQIHFE